MIRYIKRDLFKAKSTAILVHAVNCQGVMGSGIAVEFKQRFPKAFNQYAKDCRKLGKELVGEAIIYDEGDQEGILMGCLFTSFNYGENVDSNAKILKATARSLKKLLDHHENYIGHWIYSNKFNSGKFGVPWHKTEDILANALHERPGVMWTVCSPPWEVKP